MHTGSEAVRVLHDAVRAMPPGRWLLAVSGGRDSMVLLDACAATRDDVCAVATFDHGTGPAARNAAEAVEMECMRRGIPVVSGRGTGARDEAAWRAERWEFLGGWAAELGARVATAHTRDDQAETVFIRILRDAGVRGLAGMFAQSPIARPLLGVGRETVAAYAAEQKVGWVDDPSNASLAHLRNRVRKELLPACERARPGFTAWLVDLSRRAESVRAAVAATVDGLLGPAGARGGPVEPGTLEAGPLPARRAQQTAALSVVVPAAALAGLPDASRRLLWPEIASRAAVALDRRGIERLAAEAERLKPGSAIPLSNGVSVSRTVTTLVLRNRGNHSPLY